MIALREASSRQFPDRSGGYVLLATQERWSDLDSLLAQAANEG
jgi:hypothetical protein